MIKKLLGDHENHWVRERVTQAFYIPVKGFSLPSNIKLTRGIIAPQGLILLSK